MPGRTCFLHAKSFSNVIYDQLFILKEVEYLQPRRMSKGFAKLRVKFQYFFFHGRLLIPLFIFHKKYFSNPTFSHFAQIAFFM